MNILYIIIIAVFGILISIGVGLELSKTIDDTITYLLFWILYVLTIITFINIVVAVYFYLAMKNKQGPPGIQGVMGDRGIVGSTGICDPTCRDNICYNNVLSSINDNLTNLNGGSSIALNNVYIKGKIKQMCSSNEFKQLAPYNGPMNLINYLNAVWKNWIDALYNAGGQTYFETIGAETEWEWVNNNPFDDIKKYDIFYWGMGPEYRPQLIDKCYKTDENGNITGSPQQMLKLSTTDLYDFITNDDGIGAYNRASFWRPKKFTYNSITYYPLGDIVIGPDRSNETIKINRHIGAIHLPESSTGPNRETILVSGDVLGPVNYNLIWSNVNSKGNQIWVWRPIGPSTRDGDYLALGDIITTTADMPPTGDNAPIRCIPLAMLTKMQANGNVLWSSTGSQVNTNLNMLGHVPNNGVYTNAYPINAYNLFRAVNGYSTSIPASDINGSFYYITQNLDPLSMPGANAGTPPVNLSAHMSGKGYLPSPVKDAKYSILAYLNMKNTAQLTHVKTQTQITINIVPNTTGMIYTITINNKCLNNVGGIIRLSTCDSLQMGQIFSLEFTNNIQGQCRLISSSGTNDMYLILDTDNNFMLTNIISNKNTSNDLSLFMMQ